ncbi:hypothetical protein ABRQ03_12450 [Pectobacterium jejuense]|uniref:hypothetical protein n=1 Tax=Pectobacterium jejuense TaxID=2974022 RepID=UPI0032F03BE9
MDNNILFITSIEKFNDFEEVVRRFLQRIFNADAYITNGPYDGGKDVVYSIRGREKKEVIQVSITKQNLETKLEEDLIKTDNLIQEHNYPPVLHFFWSQKISESKLDILKSNARMNYGITLEFYDANRISQKITNDYPEILTFLLEDIHKYRSSKKDDLDIKEMAFYEYLLLSKDAANLKNVIIDSYIVSLLTVQGKSESDLRNETQVLGLHHETLKNRLYNLKRDNRIVIENNIYILSDVESNRIKNLELKEIAKRNEVLTIIGNATSEYFSENISSEVLVLIKEAYAESVNLQLNELNFESPKNQIVKEIIKQLERLIIEKGKITSLLSSKLANELVELSGQNEYLSDYCSSRLCITLLNQKKLERYINNKTFYMYLDAPVLIPYLIALRYDNFSDGEKSINIVKTLKKIIYNVKNRHLRVTQEHLEETARHLENAIKISSFANDELVRKIGNSKNVFFNTYLNLKKNQPKDYNFEKFLDDFIGYEGSPDPIHLKFYKLSRSVSQYLNLNKIDVISTTAYQDDRIIDDVVRKFSRQIYGAKRRNQRTINNDIYAALVLSDDSIHCDEKGVGQTPMLITWDATQHTLRNIVRQKDNYKEWLVYTPQRAIERLSMLEMKIESSAIKDGVLAIIDEDYFFKDNDSNLIDTLALLVKDDEPDAGALTTLINKLSQRVTEESLDSHDIEKETFNTLNEVLTFTYSEFKDNFSQIKTVFSDVKYTESIFEILTSTLKGPFDESSRKEYKIKIDKVITAHFG